MRRAFHSFSWGSLTSLAMGKEPSNLGLSSGFFDEESRVRTRGVHGSSTQTKRGFDPGTQNFGSEGWRPMPKPKNYRVPNNFG